MHIKKEKKKLYREMQPRCDWHINFIHRMKFNKINRSVKLQQLIMKYLFDSALFTTLFSFVTVDVGFPKNDLKT